MGRTREVGVAVPPLQRGKEEALKFFIEDPGTGTLYKRGQRLGKGAFGRCYKFTDTSTNKVYAVKVVPQSQDTRMEPRGKVEREIELHSQLQHPHVVGFYRHFADEDNIYLVLEYCSRKSLAHILKARKVLTEPEVRFYLKQILAGLHYLHQQGIIHRDLKLSNLFVTKRMQVKIGDLGLAVREQQAGQSRGVVCGTPNYLAPEVITKKGHSFQSDIWALGCIMYTALTGFPPFEITHKPEMYRRIQEGRYLVPSSLSHNARELLERLLAPNPAARPSLEEILLHPFFTQGFTPSRLPSWACHSAPLFALPSPLQKLLQKASKVLFRGGPCGESTAESQDPQEGGQILPQEVLPSPPPQLPLHSAKRDRKGEEGPSTFPIRLLMTGSLKDSWTEAAGGAEWSPGGVLEMLDHTLWETLRTVPLAKENPQEDPWWPLPVRMVTKWVDYSNKYGFGYQLSDGATGVLLADGTHLALYPQHQHVTYCAQAGRVATFPQTEVPAFLKAKMEALGFFSQYMQQWLLEGAPQQTSPSGSADELTLLHWAKTDEALLMVFSDGSLQVNFYHDRTKVAFGRSGRKTLLTFVDRQRCSATFSLETLVQEGWALPLRERVVYALHMLRSL